MKQSKTEIEKRLVFAKPEDEFYFFEDIDTKEKRTLAQNSTFYMILSGIAKHLGLDTQEVKIYMLGGAFGTHKLQLSKTEIEIPNISHTSELTKEQAIFFIDVLQAFCKAKDIPIEITPKQIQSLYGSYNITK